MQTRANPRNRRYIMPGRRSPEDCRFPRSFRARLASTGKKTQAENRVSERDTLPAVRRLTRSRGFEVSFALALSSPGEVSFFDCRPPGSGLRLEAPGVRVAGTSYRSAGSLARYVGRLFTGRGRSFVVPCEISPHFLRPLSWFAILKSRMVTSLMVTDAYVYKYIHIYIILCVVFCVRCAAVR